MVDPVSMHLSFDRLGGMVKRLGLDPTTGHLFVFVNRPKTHMKVLFYDRSGFCQVYNHLASHYTSSGWRLHVDNGSETRRCARCSSVSQRLGPGTGALGPGGS